MKSYIEFCNEQAEKLFQIIDTHGGLLKWRKTWNVQGSLGLPKSRNGYYQGVNLWSLLFTQINRGLVSDTWWTFNQVKAQSGLSPKLQTLLSKLQVNISEFGNQPCYKPMEDVIVMPRYEYFDSEQNYNLTFCHELIHWTGHLTRLNRDCARDYAKNEAARAEEELVAEIGSVFLASYFGLSGDLVNHASYVASWKKYLDGKSVGRAMSQASKAFNWLITHLEAQEKEAAA